MNNNKLYNKILKDISKVVKTSINEAFDFGSAGKNTKKNSAIISTVRHEVLKKNIEDFFDFCKGYMSGGNFVIDDSRQGTWILTSDAGYRGNMENVKLTLTNNSVFDCTINLLSISLYSDKAKGKNTTDIVFEIFSEASKYNLNIGTGILKSPDAFGVFNANTLANMSPDMLPSKLTYQSAYRDNNGQELANVLGIVLHEKNSTSLDNSMMPMIEYLQNNFVDLIFANFSGADQEFINENVYRLGIPNVQEYLK